jgi:hypothetical protein
VESLCEGRYTEENRGKVDTDARGVLTGRQIRTDKALL